MGKLECKICNREFDTEDSLNQHIKARHSVPESEKKNISAKTKKKYAILGIVIIAVLLFAYAFYARAQKPGSYDDFAKCLTEKGVVVYGNNFCQYTAKQMNFFGKSKEYLNYVKCIDNKDLCDSKNIRKTPTWEINGKFYPEVRTFKELSELSGCKV